MLARWAKESETHPKDSRLMLAYTRDDVREFNEAARTLRRQRGELGREEQIQTARGAKAMAVNDRVYFLRNEKSLGVRNGTIGTIEAVADNIVQVRLDGDERRVAVDTRFYNDLDYGYAATVYKAQGTTVDRTYLLATAHYDRHATYVGLSRHRDCATVFYAAEDFGALAETSAQRREIQKRLFTALSRARPKKLVHDYLEPSVPLPEPALDRTKPRSPADVRREAREAWLAMRSQQPTPTPQELRQQGIEDWRRLRENSQREPQQQRARERERERGQERDGPELDL